jgi:hypothetical protein
MEGLRRIIVSSIHAERPVFVFLSRAFFPTHSLQLFGRWQYSRNLLFRANYWYQRYRSTDWAFDNATPWSSNNVLLTGQPNASYTAHVFGISVAYTNW